MPGSTVCGIFPADLAIKALSKLRGGLTQSGNPGVMTGSEIGCSIDVLKDGMRSPAILFRLTVREADSYFPRISQGLRSSPYLTLPRVLGEGYARDNHAGLLRVCREPGASRNEHYMIDIGVEEDTGVISRTDLAKVITDAVPFLDKHMGCAPVTRSAT
jgi:hypothetical protein